jgi:SAM-dependent methyltransferase
MGVPRITPRFQYPKQLPALSEEQERQRHEFMRHWQEVLPSQYSTLERFNHVGAFGWPLPPNCRTLEVGGGIGGHLEFEDLGRQTYTVNEIRAEWAEVIRQRFPTVKLLVGDIQKGLDCPDNSFDRVIAVHVLEHLTHLPDALAEIDRLLVPGGVLQAVLPCEGGLAYSLAREISAKRMFRKRYKADYMPIVAAEHVSVIEEIEAELGKRFDLAWKRFYPLPFVPLDTLNLVIGTVWRTRKKA